MSIISTIGRRQKKVRALFIGMYAFLIIGGATMIYPFLLMISGSTKSAIDIARFDVVPRYLYDRDWMFSKHLEGVFNENLSHLNYVYDRSEYAFEALGSAGKPNLKLVEAWTAFRKEVPLPDYAYVRSYMASPRSRTVPDGLRGFRHRLEERFGKDIDDVNRALGTEFLSWQNLSFTLPTLYMRRDKPATNAFGKELTAYMSEAPEGLRIYYSPDGFYRRLYLRPRYTDQELAELPGGLPHLTRTYPVGAPVRVRDDWEHFVREVLSSAWIRVDAWALGEYHTYLRARHAGTEAGSALAHLNKRYGTAYGSVEEIPVPVVDVAAERLAVKEHCKGDIQVFNRSEGTHYRSFEEIPLVAEPVFAGFAAAEWDSFLIGFRDGEKGHTYKAPLSSLRVHSVENQFQSWLLKRYGSLAAAREALGMDWKRAEDIRMPLRDVHLEYFDRHIRDLRWEFVTRNYKLVLDYLLFHGRGILNTVIYCGLTILSALLVNPLAAYAMSRYRMPSTYKILLFMMCTMAFPPMVTAIPNFIMLRQFELLNTFWALILPGMANGYSIFLLKGFFDSLPKELYESAQLDGATEWTLFWQITMGLSKPILAVIALNAFTASYANFMFAFMICQDRKMWTVMVWLYQLQMQYGQAVVYASLVIAAIPTFLIFLFCQNMIMRGIVVPSEK